MKNSKQNLARRQSRIQERLDRKWQPETDHPVLEVGNVCYEVSGRVEAASCGGLGMMQEVVKAAGLREKLDEHLHLLKRHVPYHESDHVLSLVYNVLSGGVCLEDLEARRQDSAFLEAVGARRIPGSTTAGDFLRRFGTSDVEDLMEAINAARAKVWRCQPAQERRLARIDADGTLAETLGERKEGMNVSYNGRWGFQPLLISLANTQEPLYLVNRPANRPSQDRAEVYLDKAAAWAREKGGFQRVRFRGDTAFSLTEHFDRWTDAGIEFVFGMDTHPSFVKRARGLRETTWTCLERPASPPAQRQRAENVKRAVVEARKYRQLTLLEEHVAELAHSPHRAKQTYRLIVLRKKIRVTQGQLRLEDEVRYHFYVTNIPASVLDPVGVVLENNARCAQENLIEQLKNGVQAMRMPVREFSGNWAYLVIASLAWNLKAWAGLLLPKALGARQLLRLEFRRFLNQLMLIPVQVLHRSRQRIYRLLGVNRWTELLLEGTQRLKLGHLG